MKAPDKIYISHAIYDTWQFTIPDPNDKTEVEYIRKDALLEWVKEHYDRSKFIYNIKRASAVYGKMDTYKEIIDKIESL